jgi:trigger factor
MAEDTETKEVEETEDQEASTEETEASDQEASTEEAEASEQEASTEEAEASEQEASTEEAEASEHDHDHDHDDEGEDEFDVSYDIEDIGACHKKFTVTIPSGDANKTLEESFKLLRTEANVPGFRPGRVPQWLLEKRFGRQVRGDLVNRFMQGGMRKAITEAGISPIGMPEFDDEVAKELDLSQDFTFEFSVYVRPEFELDEETYLEMEIEIPSLEVTDKIVEQGLRSVFESEGKLQDAGEGEAADKGDVVACNVSVTAEGEDLWSEDGLNVQVTENARSTSMLPELIDLAEGTKVGDEKEESITLSDSFALEEHRGKEATLKLKVTGLKKMVYPEFTDELAKEKGLESIGEIRDKITERFEQQFKQLTDMAVEDKMTEKLLEISDFELPEQLIEKHTESRVQRRRLELEAEGATETDILEELQGFKDSSREELLNEMKLIFTMQYICEKQGIEVDEGDIDDRIEEIASSSGRDPFDLRDEMEESGRIDVLQEQLLRDKTLDLLKRKAVITTADDDEDDEDED